MARLRPSSLPSDDYFGPWEFGPSAVLSSLTLFNALLLTCCFPPRARPEAAPRPLDRGARWRVTRAGRGLRGPFRDRFF